MKINRWFQYCLLLACAAGTLPGQDTTGDRITIPVSDPSRPVLVKANVIGGNITVQAYDGKDVIVQATPPTDRESRGGRNREEKAQGMKRIVNTATGLTASEQNNVVEIGTSSFGRSVNLTLQVPRKANLKLSTINDGDIKVEHVQGDIEAQNINGAITLTDISGSAVVNATNEDIVVTFSEVTPGKPMSFSSLNGKIDVTFPASLKANLVMKTSNGDIFSDFDLQLQPNASKPQVEDTRDKGGKYKIKLDRAVYGTVNGGGPEIQFKGFNGDIYIRKSGK